MLLFKEVGSITKLYDHTEQSHASSVFRVVKFQGRGVTGYLECQVGIGFGWINTHFLICVFSLRCAATSVLGLRNISRRPISTRSIRWRTRSTAASTCTR